ncbi:MAG: iron complex transport system substrate-binding protein [Gammaproteobacteria bacterium]|jgi:iron complex transport system substrate-binding protein
MTRKPTIIRTLAILFSVMIMSLSGISKASSVKGIVSLDLCTDWMLLKYADRNQVRAFSSLLYKYHADWVPLGLPLHDGSLENILQLEPELLITGEYNALLLRKRLVQLGKNVSVLSLPTNLDNIQNYHREFLTLIDVDPGKNPVDWNKTYPDRNQSLLLLGPNGIGTGKKTLENDLLHKAGWQNYLGSTGYISLDMERIVDQPPDAIYWSAPESQSLSNLFIDHPAITQITNNRQQPEKENWRWQCPGPWSLDLIEELSQWQKY